MSRYGRWAAILLGATLTALGVALLLAGPHGPGVPPLLIGLMTLASVFFERRYRRAKADAAPSGPGWRATDETFRDEESGRWVRVWYNSASGERRYVPVEPPRG